MTTIVSDLRCMAADQRITGGGPIAHITKIHRIKGSLFGIAGHACLAAHILKWLSGSRDPEVLFKLIPPDHRDDVEVLELSKDGLAFWNGWGARLPLLDGSYAIGSGAMGALQALRLGMPPDKAILHTLSLDEGSGISSEPQVEHLVRASLSPRKRK